MPVSINGLLGLQLATDKRLVTLPIFDCAALAPPAFRTRPEGLTGVHDHRIAGADFY